MTLPPCPSSWCDIHRERISANIGLALHMLPKGKRMCAVMKADAYGHGIAQVVPLVMAHGIDCIGITSNEEARTVREAGFDGTLIRIRAATVSEMAEAQQHRVEEQVSSVEIATYLAAEQPDTPAHLALNASGMSRDGLEIGSPDGPAACLEIIRLLGARIIGITTHFPSNAPDDLRASDRLFQEHVRWVIGHSDLDRTRVTVHAGSSLTLISDVPVAGDMFRCGAIFYGILRPDAGFAPTMDLKSRVVSLQHYEAGQTVGYDRGHVLGAPRSIASVSIGYANGITRVSQGRGEVLIGGQRAPVVGKISMNTITVDVTGLDVRVGQEVILFGGRETAITTAQSEAQFGTIMAELYTDWGGRNLRIYR